MSADSPPTPVEIARGPLPVPSVPAPVPVAPSDDLLPVRARRRRAARSRSRRMLVEWAVVVVVALGLAVLVRAEVAQMFFIPSGSMLPTLQIGDRIVVDKLSYQLGSVHRGDIVVFGRPPLEQSDYSDLVKRVVGLPGDVLSVSGGRLFVDGLPQAEPWLPDPAPPTVASPLAAAFSLEHPYRVPPGEYYVMGDNRTDSEDSRYFGPIPGSLIVGKMAFRVWPLSRADALIALAVLAVVLAVALVTEWRSPRRAVTRSSARPVPGRPAD